MKTAAVVATAVAATIAVIALANRTAMGRKLLAA